MGRWLTPDPGGLKAAAFPLGEAPSPTAPTDRAFLMPALLEGPKETGRATRRSYMRTSGALG